MPYMINWSTLQSHSIIISSAITIHAWAVDGMIMILVEKYVIVICRLPTLRNAPYAIYVIFEAQAVSDRLISIISCFIKYQWTMGMIYFGTSTYYSQNIILPVAAL